LPIGAVALISAAVIVSSIYSSTGPDAIAKQLERMANDGKRFDPVRLHALGPDGLKAVLAFLSDRYPQRSIGPTPSYAAGFDVYARGINDRQRLLLLAQHLQFQLKDGVPYVDELSRNNDKPRVIISCVEAFARNDQDENAGTYAAALVPCLEYANGQVGLWLIRALNGHDNGDPLIAYALMVEALDSENPELVKEALGWATECARTNKRQLVKERLLQIFNGPDEANKFQACFALMHQFKHQEAVDYLLKQTASPDKERAVRSIEWIGDTCNWGQPAYPALLNALDPHLASDDPDLRRSAVDALNTYAGREVSTRLIEALADENREIVSSARRGLTDRVTSFALHLGHHDLVVSLEKLALVHEDAQVRNHCAAILDAVEQHEQRIRPSESLRLEKTK
jgi:hypothetical protein